MRIATVGERARRQVATGGCPHPARGASGAGALGSAALLHHQRTAGNRAVGRLSQRAPDDLPEWPGPGATVDEARRAAAALEAQAKAAAANGGFVPSWAVDEASQAGWRAVQVADLAPQEMELLREVVAAREVIAGRSVNVAGRGMLLLDEWLAARGITWTQRWQTVYSKSLFLRAAAGRPVNVMAGGGYSAAEAAAAEGGAAARGVRGLNRPYWPESAPSTGGGAAAPRGTPGVGGAGTAAEEAGTMAERALIGAGAQGALRAGVAATVLEVAFNPALQAGYYMLTGLAGDYQEAWRRIREPARHIGFAHGWVAKLVGLDRAWIREHLAPKFVDRGNVAVQVLAAGGMREEAYILGLSEGIRYGEGYELATARKPLGRAFAAIRARGGEIGFDEDGALTRNSLILVAATLQPDADRAIARWEELREQRRRRAIEEANAKYANRPDSRPL